MNQSYPRAYAIDVKEMEGNMGKVIESGESVKEEDLEKMNKLWERVFDQAYDKAGCPLIGGPDVVKPLIHWEVTDTDVNVKYRPLLPRFLLEVSWIVSSLLEIYPIMCFCIKYECCSKKIKYEYALNITSMTNTVESQYTVFLLS